MADELKFRYSELAQQTEPLGVILTLIQKNKMKITDISISVICDQYMEYLHTVQAMDMEVTSEFIIMASELMFIKSKMLLPRLEDEEDPRAPLQDALIKYQQAKTAAKLMAPMYAVYSGRLEKDTDEIEVDKSYVADQNVTALCQAVRRIIAARADDKEKQKVTFTPMIASPIVPVEVKIIGILEHIKAKGSATVEELLWDSSSLNDMIAIFLGILELMKLDQIVIQSDEDITNVALHNKNTRLILGEKYEEGDIGELKVDEFDVNQAKLLAAEAKKEADRIKAEAERKKQARKAALQAKKANPEGESSLPPPRRKKHKSAKKCLWSMPTAPRLSRKRKRVDRSWMKKSDKIKATPMCLCARSTIWKKPSKPSSMPPDTRCGLISSPRYWAFSRAMCVNS